MLLSVELSRRWRCETLSSRTVYGKYADAPIWSITCGILDVGDNGDGTTAVVLLKYYIKFLTFLPRQRWSRLSFRWLSVQRLITKVK